MFRLDVLETDAFMDMPLTTQALYFHLSLRADDDGFVGNPKRITKNIGAGEDDLKLLIAKRFVLVFDDGVIVIKHWRLHNSLSGNRYHETKYLEDKALLTIKDNGAYTLNGDGKEIDDSHYIEMGKRQTKDETKTNNRRTIDETKTDTDKNSIDKNSIDYSLSDTKKDIETVFAAWNKTTFKPISKLKSGTKRYDSLHTRIQEYGIDQVLEAISNAEESKYLHSDKGSWFNFDWFVKPNNFPKVLERNYNDSVKPLEKPLEKAPVDNEEEMTDEEWFAYQQKLAEQENEIHTV